MGVEREHIPEAYLCEVCQPRYVDRRKAMLVQRKRYELLTGTSESSDTLNTRKLRTGMRLV